MLKSIYLFIAAIIFSQIVTAQNTTPAAVQPVMEQHGKIYVVMLVCLVVLGGLIIYLLLLDRSIAKMEKEKK